MHLVYIFMQVKYYHYPWRGFLDMYYEFELQSLNLWIYKFIYF